MRIRTDFSLSPIPSNLAKDISQNLNQTRGRFSIRTCFKAVRVSLLQYIVLSCAIRAQKAEHVSTKLFWRRNKLMSYSMIIDIYYPIELNWIEQVSTSWQHFPKLPISMRGCKLLQYPKYPPPSLHAKCVFCSSNLAFLSMMRISVFAINLHHIPIKEQLTCC